MNWNLSLKNVIWPYIVNVIFNIIIIVNFFVNVSEINDYNK